VELSLRLEPKQTQKLLITPTLRQAIKLLQLTKLELVQAVRQELVENPLLEEVTSDEILEAEENGGIKEETQPEDTFSEEERLISEVDWEDYFNDNVQLDSNYKDKQDIPSWENTFVKPPSLHEHLLWQLRLSTSTPQEHKIGEQIIGNIDEYGYLQASLAEIAQATQATEKEVARVLKLIQSFEPAGVGARSLEECLLLQVKEPEPRAGLLRQLIQNHLPNLERKRYGAIANSLRISLDQVIELSQIIASYDPKPGRQFNPDQVRYVIPDVFVYKVDDEYVVVLNDEGIPRLRISNVYKKILRKGANVPPATRKYMEEKFRSAVWLIRSIQQRQSTLYKVTKSIVKFQRDFLDDGISGLKPLTLKDVAQDISMHESTVSRVTTNKYVHTPRGIYELKYFFHSGLCANDGEEVSSVRIKDLIKKIVATEDKTRPLTDIQILNILRQQGINIARRTITKYREALNILPSSRRKEFYTSNLKVH